MIKHNDSLECLIEKLNKKPIVTVLEQKQLKELLAKEDPRRMGLIIMIDMRLGKACIPDINEWARSKYPELSPEDKEHVRMFLPSGHVEKYLDKQFKIKANE